MTDETQLRLQIQQEIDREAKIDRLIEAKTKRFLKANKQFYQVPELKDCDAVLFYFRDDLTKFHIKLYSELNEAFNHLHELKRMYFVYLKNKNNHHAKIHTKAFIRKSTPYKDFGK